MTNDNVLQQLDDADLEIASLRAEREKSIKWEQDYMRVVLLQQATKEQLAAEVEKVNKLQELVLKRDAEIAQLTFKLAGIDKQLFAEAIPKSYEPDRALTIKQMQDKLAAEREAAKKAYAEGWRVGRDFAVEGQRDTASNPALAEQESPLGWVSLKEYQAFLSECSKHCRCSMTICESVLAGGPCEERIEPDDLDDNLP